MVPAQRRLLQTLSRRSAFLPQTRQYMQPSYEFRDSLERGRKQYRLRNAISFVALGGLVTSIYLYSMYAVEQEDFSDVPMPDEKKE